jgi:hypothetical protein
MADTIPPSPAPVPGWLRLATQVCWHLSGPVLFAGWLVQFLPNLASSAGSVAGTLMWLGYVLFVLAWILVVLVWMLQPSPPGEGGRGLKGAIAIGGILLAAVAAVVFGRSLDWSTQPGLTVGWASLRFIFIVLACGMSIMRRPPFLGAR